MDDRVGNAQSGRDWLISTKGLDDVCCCPHEEELTEGVSACQAELTALVIDTQNTSAHQWGMLTASEILNLLAERKVPKKDIATAIGVEPPRVTELYKGERRLMYEEGRKLIEAFELGEYREPLNERAARLAVLYVATSLGQPLAPEDHRLKALAQSLQALASSANDAAAVDQIEEAGFVRGLSLVRSQPD